MSIVKNYSIRRRLKKLSLGKMWGAVDNDPLYLTDQVTSHPLTYTFTRTRAIRNYKWRGGRKFKVSTELGF